MKRFTLFLFAAMAAAVSFAQTVGAHGETIDEHGIITAIPADLEVKNFKRSGLYGIFQDIEDEYGNTSSGIQLYEDNMTTDIAECEDGTVFIKGILSQTGYKSWVVGQRDGNAVTVKMGQHLAYDEGCTISLLRNIVQLAADGESAEMVVGRQDLIFDVKEDHGNEVWVVRELDYNVFNYNFITAMYDDDNNTFVHVHGYPYMGDYESESSTSGPTELSYNPNGESEYDVPVVLPANVKMEDYRIHCYSYLQTKENGNKDKYIDYDITMGFDGDDVYIAGLYYFTPEYIVKGKNVDGVITFPQHQLLGVDGRNVAVYAIACGYGYDEEGYECMVDEDSWKLYYSEDDDVYDGADSVVRFARNPYYKYGNMYEAIDEIEIRRNETGINTVLAPKNGNAAIYDIHGRQTKQTEGLVITNAGGKMQKRIVR